ncbi:EI24 domain-containing protein [Microlunatus ginsengisoli]|uniref:EI24 domain-containing protein n=1 Tax=Microlunatus ginsengisoli TaxID=363863 RepID=A0ABP6ZEL3_9ACTN
MANPVSEAVSGLGLLVRGLGLIVRRPRNFALGAIPPAITSVLFLIVIVVLGGELRPLTRWLTPFARDWSEGAESAIQIAVGVALVGVTVLLMVVTFTALTLAIGGPIYDKIGEYVDSELGGEQPAHEEPLVRSIGRAIRQSLALIAVSALGAIPLFLAGFIPVVGQSVVPVVAAMFGGWLLAIELLGGPFERRGRLTIAERRAAMRTRRLHVWGFAAPTFALLAVPFLAILVFPAAAAGATLLARELLADVPAGQDTPRVS